MYGREELEPMSDLFLDMGVDVEGNRNYQPWAAYDKDEADKVMDAMERRIARLTALVEGFKKNSLVLGEMYHKRLAQEQARIKELEAENESLRKYVSELESKTADYIKMQKQVKELEEQLHELAEREYVLCRKKIKELEAENERLKGENEKLEKKLKKAENAFCVAHHCINRATIGCRKNCRKMEEFLFTIEEED